MIKSHVHALTEKSFVSLKLHKCYYLAVPQKALGKHPKWTIVDRWLWPPLLGERHSSLQGFLPQTAKTIYHATSSLRRMLGSHKLGCFDTLKVFANHINKTYLKTTLYFLQSVKTDFLTMKTEIDSILHLIWRFLMPSNPIHPLKAHAATSV